MKASGTDTRKFEAALAEPISGSNETRWLADVIEKSEVSLGGTCSAFATARHIQTVVTVTQGERPDHALPFDVEIH